MASINGNPEWDEEHRYPETEMPHPDTQTIIFLEKVNDRWLKWAKQNGAQTIYVPMWELFRKEPEERWARECDVVTAIAHQAIQNAVGREVLPLEWDPGLLPRRPQYKDIVTFFHDARGIEQGKYDVRPRQQTKLVLEAFLEAREKLFKLKREIRMVLRTRNTPIPNMPEWVEQREGEFSRPDLFDDIRECSMALAPSGPEGLGLPVWEFQALAVPPIVMDVLPANKAVTHGVDGWLVKADDGGPASLARKWSPNHDELVRAITMCSDRDTVNRMKEACFDTATRRYGAFSRFLIRLLNQ